MRASVFATALALGLSGIASLAGAQQPRLAVIDGAVTDTALAVIAGAQVSVLGSQLQVTTGANGRFRIVALPLGTHLLVVRRLGFEAIAYPVRLETPDTLRLSIALNPVAETLDTVVVSSPTNVDMSGFEERRKLGFGHFLTESEIATQHVVWVADLLRGIPSIHVSEHGFDQVAYSLRNPGQCRMRVYLDGMRVPDTPGMTALSVVPPPNELRGIEIYSGPATIPLQYKTVGSGCGVILVWTKAGP